MSTCTGVMANAQLLPTGTRAVSLTCSDPSSVRTIDLPGNTKVFLTPWSSVTTSSTAGRSLIPWQSWLVGRGRRRPGPPGIGTLPDGEQLSCFPVDAAGDAHHGRAGVRHCLGKAERPVSNSKIINLNLPEPVTVGGHPDHILIFHVLGLNGAKHQGPRHPLVLGEINAKNVPLQSALLQNALERGEISRLPKSLGEVKSQNSIKKHVLKHVIIVTRCWAFKNACPQVLVVNGDSGQGHILEDQHQVNTPTPVFQVTCLLIFRDPHCLRRYRAIRFSRLANFTGALRARNPQLRAPSIHQNAKGLRRRPNPDFSYVLFHIYVLQFLGIAAVVFRKALQRLHHQAGMRIHVLGRQSHLHGLPSKCKNQGT
mmetsp:Transcript_33390/g.74771  ORF Transcript_33390/g.74771 Transcript_33390/m.74771 type:complete len:369 (-) Transcript_33390:60-1166(-)